MLYRIMNFGFGSQITPQRLRSPRHYIFLNSEENDDTIERNIYRRFARKSFERPIAVIDEDWLIPYLRFDWKREEFDRKRRTTFL